MASDLDRYFRLWGLAAEQEPVETQFSLLCFVRSPAGPAVLKLLKPDSDETASAATLNYYGGEGAVRLLRAEGPALLMERASGLRSLRRLAVEGSDRQAAVILAGAMTRLLAPRSRPAPAALEPLADRFRPLTGWHHEDPLLERAAAVARDLLAGSRDSAVLHGDLHHGNLLDGGARGWPAIDPKGVLGERGYEAANVLCNPSSDSALVLQPERFRWQAGLFAETLGVEDRRLLALAFAHAGLAFCWSLMDDTDPAHWQDCLAVLAPLVDDFTP